MIPHILHNSHLQFENIVLNRISLRMRMVFVKHCISWMLHGHLCDRSDEFFISSKNHVISDEGIDARFVYRMGKLLVTREVTFDFDWNESFSLRMDMLPCSLLSTKAAIDMLFIGKTIKLCQNISKKSLSNELYGINDSFSCGVDRRQCFHERERLPFLKEAEILCHFRNHNFNEGNLRVFDSKRKIKSKTVEEVSLKMIKHIENELYNTLLCTREFNAAFDHLLSTSSAELSSSVWSMLEESCCIRKQLFFLRNTYLLGSGEFSYVFINEVLNVVQFGNYLKESSFVEGINRRTVELLGIHDEMGRVVNVRKSNSLGFSLPMPVFEKSEFSTRGSCRFENECIIFSAADMQHVNTLSSVIWKQRFEHALPLEEMCPKYYFFEGAIPFTEEVYVEKYFAGFLCGQYNTHILENTSSNGTLPQKIGSLSAIFHFGENGVVEIGTDYVFSGCSQSKPCIRLSVKYSWSAHGISGCLNDKVDCMIPPIEMSSGTNSDIILEFEYTRTDANLRSVLKARVQTNRDSYAKEDDHWDLSVPVEFPMEQGCYTNMEVVASGMMYETSILNSLDNEGIRIQSCEWKLLDVRFEGRNFPVYSVDIFSKLRSAEIAEEFRQIYLRYQCSINVDLKFESPVSLDLLVDSGSLRIYKRLFGTLYKLKTVSLALQKTWLRNSYANNRFFQHTRHIMQYYTTSLFFHFQFNVVESRFNQYMQDIENHHDLRSVVQMHRSFLNSVASMCMIDSVAVRASMSKVLQACLHFLAVCHLCNNDAFSFVSSEREIRSIFYNFSVALTHLIHLLQRVCHSTRSVTLNLDSGYLSGLMKKLNEA